MINQMSATCTDVKSFLGLCIMLYLSPQFKQHLRFLFITKYILNASHSAMALAQFHGRCTLDRILWNNSLITV